ncbi:MAG TPA: polyadenylate-specific 3'-exoribonuclease AS [Mycobacteriales bacterium]|nr:polyadenylate-specific 3'-exoribonuclease AS [Mycobacteriales bacterium]
MSVARYVYDTEFIEDGRTIDLVSIGVVSVDGDREFYAVSSEHDPTQAIRWVRDHVLAQLPSPSSPVWRSRAQIRAELLEFLTGVPGTVELWAWYGGYDHVALCQLWGDMRSLPRELPRFTRDLRQRWEDVGCPPLPPDPPQAHDALADARHNLARWRVIQQHWPPSR